MKVDAYPENRAELVEWIISAVRETIEAVRTGTYNDFVKRNLPYAKRRGKILREDLWRIFPEEKAAYLEDVTQDEIDRFVLLIEDRPEDKPRGRLPEMTAGKFFDFCRLGYEANRYRGTGELDAKGLYKAHADGRDEGLLKLDLDSADEYAAWYHDKTRRGGHPWEICRGGNSTHISLYVNDDENGWWLSLAGSSYVRSIETVKFYLALADAGLPVSLRDGKGLADMITGRDHIGIVPEDVFPRYCSMIFRGEHMLQYMNLPYEKREEIIAASYWYPIEKVRLA